MRSQSQTKLFDRRSRNDWMERSQGKELRDQAYEHAVEILKNHQAPALPSGAAEAMSKIVSEFEKEIEKEGKA
jgi:trimethylamine:corrinoid methyltransferase-like protein